MSHEETIHTHQRSVSRELSSIGYLREQRPTADLEFSDKLTRARTSLEQVRSELEVGRTALGAQVADIEAWLAKHEQDVKTLELLDEAVAALKVEAQVEGYQSMRLTQALDSVQRMFDDNPEKAEQAWDAVKQLIGPLDQPKYEVVPEIAKLLGTFRALRERVTAELAPKVAAYRAAPLIRVVQSAIDELRYAIDRGDEDLAFQRRAALRKAMAPLPLGCPSRRTSRTRRRRRSGAPTTRSDRSSSCASSSTSRKRCSRSSRTSSAGWPRHPRRAWWSLLRGCVRAWRRSHRSSRTTARAGWTSVRAPR